MDYPQIIEYLNGHGSSDQQKAVEQWIQEDPKHQAVFEKVKKIWLDAASEEEKEAIDVPKAWQNVAGHLQKEKSRIIYRKRSWAGLAAVLLLGVLTYVSRDLWMTNPMQTVVAENGIRPTEVKLSDGSTVWLNQNSQLIFPKKFKGKERKVILEGEAYFDVQRNEEKAFKISANRTEIEVLGTSFDVMAYPDSIGVRVQVASGRVGFYSATDSIYLVKDEEGFFDKTQNTLSKTEQRLKNKTSWKTKILVFEDASIKEVITLLEQIYQVSIRMENENIGRCRFNSTFDKEDLNTILETIGTLFGLEVDQKTNNEYILNGQGCPINQ